MNRRDFLASSAKASAALAVGVPAFASPRGLVIDFNVDSGHANRFDIFDAVTGEKLTHSVPIFHADEGRGFYRMYRRDEKGRFYHRLTDAATGKSVEIVPGTWFDDHDGTSSADVVGAGTIKVNAEVAWVEVRRPIRIVPKVA